MTEMMIYGLKPTVLMIALLICTAIAMRVMRSRLIPRCVCCGSDRVRQMRADGLAERLASLVQIRAHRCERCTEEFYGILLFGTARKQRGGVKITFKPHGVVIRRIILDRTPARRRVHRKPGSISGSPAIFEH
jgi:hypothetical protein